MKNIFMIATLVILFASCSKDKHPEPVAPKEKRLAEIKNFSYPNASSTITYDAQGRAVKSSNANRYIEFEYHASKIIGSMRFTSNGALDRTIEYQLDAQGHVVIEKTTSAGGNVIETTNYTYDAAGYLIKEKTVTYYNEIYETIYEISNGNPVKETYYNGGLLYTITNYTYDESVLLKGGYGMRYNYGIKNLYGTGCKNKPTGFKSYNDAGTLTSHFIYGITCDSDGYPGLWKNINQISGVTDDVQWIYE
jgi:YD repeat-containing protein